MGMHYLLQNLTPWQNFNYVIHQAAIHTIISVSIAELHKVHLKEIQLVWLLKGQNMHISIWLSLHYLFPCIFMSSVKFYGKLQTQQVINIFTCLLH